MLLVKMARELWAYRGQFASILLMAMLGVGVYAGINAEWVGLGATVDRFYARTQLTDLLVLGPSLTEADAEAARALGAVDGAELRLTLRGTASLKGDPALELNFMDAASQISQVEVRSGAGFADDPQGVWLDEAFALAHDLRVGDKISLSAYGLRMDKTVRALVIHPEYVYQPGESGDMMPDHARTGFAFMSRAALPLIARGRYTKMCVLASDPALAKAQLDEVLDGRGAVVLDRSQMISCAALDGELAQHRAMGNVFPVAFLMVALMTILTTMRRLVNAQRTIIGTLMALGFTHRRLLAHYASYGLSLSLAGAALGLGLGPVLLPPLFFEINMPVYTLPEWHAQMSWQMFAVALGMVLACTLVTRYACRQVLGEVPAQALRPKPPRAMRQGAMARTKLWARLGFGAQWNLRDAMRSPVRTVTTLVGVASCMMLLVCAFGLRGSVAEMIRWQYRDLFAFEWKVEFDEGATDAQIAHVLKAYQATGLMEQAAQFEAGGAAHAASLWVEQPTPLLRHTDHNRRFVALPAQGAALSEKLAEQLQVGVGDAFRFRPFGSDHWTQAKVGLVVRSPMEQGAWFSAPAYQVLGLPFSPTAAVTAARVDIAPDGAVSATSKAAMQAAQEEFIQVIGLMVGTLILAALLMAVTVLWNLSSMSFTERERELATLKVLGFRSARIRRLLMDQSMALAALGTAAGWPLGLVLIRFIAQSFEGTMDMPVTIGAFPLLLCALIALGASAATCALFSRRVGKIDMVASLKGVE